MCYYNFFFLKKKKENDSPISRYTIEECKSLFQESIKNDLRIWNTGTDTPCWKLKNRAPNLKGYFQISGFKKPKIMVHHLMYYLTKGALPGTGEHLSHLCHNNSCTNPKHMVIENVRINLSRNYCAFDIPCPCPNCVESNHMVNICKHEPKCLHSPRGQDEIGNNTGVNPFSL